jgi:hypothetical protein
MIIDHNPNELFGNANNESGRTLKADLADLNAFIAPAVLAQRG